MDCIDYLQEGTAKHAELNTLNALGVDRHLPESSCLPFAWSRRSTLPLESVYIAGFVDAFS